MECGVFFLWFGESGPELPTQRRPRHSRYAERRLKQPNLTPMYPLLRPGSPHTGTFSVHLARRLCFQDPHYVVRGRSLARCCHRTAVRLAFGIQVPIPRGRRASMDLHGFCSKPSLPGKWTLAEWCKPLHGKTASRRWPPVVVPQAHARLGSSEGLKMKPKDQGRGEKKAPS